MRLLRPVAIVLALAVAAASAACGPPVDLKQVLRVTDIVSGYHDAGIVDGRNKLVPSLTFRLKKSTDAEIRPLSINAVFKKLPRAGTTVAPGGQAEEDWEDVYVANVEFTANETGALTLRTNAGYTGDAPQSRADILHHTLFQDVRVHLFVKHSGAQWVEIGQYDIPRQLLTQ
jgi:hypothetical protein